MADLYHIHAFDPDKISVYINCTSVKSEVLFCELEEPKDSVVRNQI